jgi:hypothetical protein
LGPNMVTKGWLPCLCVEGHSGHRTCVLPDVRGDNVRTAAPGGGVGARHELPLSAQSIPESAGAAVPLRRRCVLAEG